MSTHAFLLLPDGNATRGSIKPWFETVWFFARWPQPFPTATVGILFPGFPKPALYPHASLNPLFRISTHSPNAVEVWPHAQSRLCCPARHHFKAIPTSLRPSHVSCRFHPTWNVLTAGGALRRRWDLRSYLRYLSPHADGPTPGPLQVLIPFASLQALAFSLRKEDRRIFRSTRICPSAELSQL